MNKRFLPILALTLLFTLSACNFPTTAKSSVDQAAAIQTAAKQTVDAHRTLDAQQTPSSTSTTAPTDTPEVTNTPLPTNTDVPTETTEIVCDSVFFVTDVTVPDGEDFSPGEVFTKTWRLRNAGSCTWTADYDLVFDSGEAMDGPASQALSASVAPGADIDISVVLTSPAAPGTYRGNWKLRNADGVVFGLPGPFYVEIDVVDSGTTTVSLFPSSQGSVRSDATINPNPNTGDTDGDKGSQAFVSFDISGIPAGATIEDVRVDFSDYDTLGDPFTSLGCLRAYQGSFFPLDAGDYAGAPLGAILRWCSAGELSSNFLDDDVKDALQGALGSATFELRLQFNETESNNDGTADMARFGDVILTVTYSEP